MILVSFNAYIIFVISPIALLTNHLGVDGYGIAKVSLLDVSQTFTWNRAGLDGTVQLILQVRSANSSDASRVYDTQTVLGRFPKTGSAIVNGTSSLGALDQYRYMITYINPHSNELSNIFDASTSGT
jgi:hypothetical protein